MKIAIIDYGMGNVASVEKAVKFIGVNSTITKNLDEIKTCDALILPGVGAFAQGMLNLEKNNLIDFLHNEVMINKMPFLGICLGMQLLATKGFEPKESQGLNWIDGEVLKIDEPELRLPHLGWNEIYSSGNGLMKNYHSKDFYFIHSYHFRVKDLNNIIATVNYGNEYVAAIKKDNIIATQFHPEKSQKYGLELLDHFLKDHA